MLQEKCEDIEYEKTMITKLKICCGLQQINKLQGMLSDLSIAKDEIKLFEETELFKSITNIEFQVQVLQVAFWPSYKQIKLQMQTQR